MKKPLINDEIAIRLLKKMVYIRLVEEEIANRYMEQEMRCPVHLSIGQEASATGICEALRKTDRVFSTHRCHGHYLAKNGDLNRMLSEIYGKIDGCCAGRGGSMHLFDDEHGIISSIPIVSSSIPLAVGSALTSKIDSRDDVSVAFLGDGSLEEGVFHESANFASLKNLPVLFVCENNLYSVFTHLDERQPDRPIADLAKAHNMTAFTADGNDVIAVYEIAQKAVQHAREGKGPVFIVLDTFRWREHCGPNYDNHIGYRTETSFQEWKQKDPIENLKSRMFAENLITQEEIDLFVSEFQVKVNEGFEFAKASPFPTPSQINSFIYAD
jgi:pyruvate dehydrogenase E1 component alpha subunit